MSAAGPHGVRAGGVPGAGGLASAALLTIAAAARALGAERVPPLTAAVAAER